ncbi:MAG TPA: TonB-dependent siderophore receptor [Crinalium sp.]
MFKQQSAGIGMMCEEMGVKRLTIWIEGLGVLLVTALIVLSSQAVKAADYEAIASQEPTIVHEPHQELAQAAIAQITDIQVNSTTEGIGLLLQTVGDLAVPTPSIVGNAVVATLSNAELELPNGDEFSIANPVEGIALITVSPLPDNRVRVVITGVDAPPTVAISADPTGLLLGIASDAEEVGQTSAEGLQIVVTGEDTNDDYTVSEAGTGNRTDTPILDTPASVQVIPQQILDDQQTLRVDDALQNISGVTGSLDPFGGSSLTLRGFTAASFTTGPILRDGFRVYDNLGFQETANLERIEILRGPASVLYGQGTPGGVINLVTKQPLSDPFYEFQLQAGSFGLIRPSFDISGPLNQDESLRYRLNAAYQNEDGFRDFDTDIERIFIAPVLSWDISDRTTLSFNAEYLDDQSPFDLGLVAVGDGVVDVPRDRITGEPDDIRQTESITLGYNLEHQFSDHWRLQNSFRYVHQNYDVEVFLPVIINETTGIITRFPSVRRYLSDDYSLQTSVVGEFSTGDIEHTLLAGVDLNWNRFDEVFTKVALANPSPLNIFDPIYGQVSRPDFDTIAPRPPFDTEANRIGVFVQDQIALGDRFIVVGGLRYDTVDFRNTAEDTSRSDDAWSPRVGLVYRVSDSVSLYANYAQSFTPNVAQGVNGNFLEPETAEGFEVGAKAELLGGDLLATLAYFDITKQNVATVIDPLTGASAATGEQRSQGIELSLAGELLPGWNVIGFYSYTDARVTQDNVIPEGNRLFNSPYNSFGLWTTYEIQQGNLQGLGLGLGVNYVGDRAGDLENSFEVDEYFLTNAALFYQRDRWRVALNINNLFDVDYIRSVSNSRRNGIVPGAPLTIVGSISVQF